MDARVVVAAILLGAGWPADVRPCLPWSTTLPIAFHTAWPEDGGAVPQGREVLLVFHAAATTSWATWHEVVKIAAPVGVNVYHVAEDGSESQVFPYVAVPWAGSNALQAGLRVAVGQASIESWVPFGTYEPFALVRVHTSGLTVGESYVVRYSMATGSGTVKGAQHFSVLEPGEPEERGTVEPEEHEDVEPEPKDSARPDGASEPISGSDSVEEAVATGEPWDSPEPETSPSLPGPEPPAAVPASDGGCGAGSGPVSVPTVWLALLGLWARRWCRRLALR